MAELVFASLACLVLLALLSLITVLIWQRLPQLEAALRAGRPNAVPQGRWRYAA